MPLSHRPVAPREEDASARDGRTKMATIVLTARVDPHPAAVRPSKWLGCLLPGRVLGVKNPGAPGYLGEALGSSERAAGASSGTAAGRHSPQRATGPAAWRRRLDTCHGETTWPGIDTPKTRAAEKTKRWQRPEELDQSRLIDPVSRRACRGSGSAGLALISGHWYYSQWGGRCSLAGLAVHTARLNLNGHEDGQVGGKLRGHPPTETLIRANLR